MRNTIFYRNTNTGLVTQTYAGMPSSFYSTTGGKPVEGAYYSGRRYLNGQLLAPGQDQPGHDISADVIAQTNPGNVSYVNNQRANAGMPAAPSTANTDPNAALGGGGNGGVPMPAEPTLDVNALYNSSFNTPEITAANKAMADKQAEIEARKKDLADREAQISDDPWLSEAQRVGKVNKLREKANADIGNLVSEYTNLQNNITSLKGDAQTKVDIGLKQYDINSNAYQQSLQKLNFLISSGALAGASGGDLSSIGASTGLSTSMLSAIVKKAGQTEPYLTTLSDSSGQYVVAIDKNTGNVINKQKVGSASGSGSGKPTTQDYANLLKTKVAGGYTLSQAFDGFLGSGLTPDEIYNIYNASSKYGPDKGDVKNLAKYGVTQPSAKSTQQNPFITGQ